MNAFQQFVRGLQAAQLDFNDVMNELRAFAEIMSKKQNSLELDEDGFFYVNASGPLDQVIDTMTGQLKKLERIKKQRDNAIDY